MLFRVSCKACCLTSIWTDDPHFLLQSVCLRYRHCEAKLVEESSARTLRRKLVLPASAASVVSKKKIPGASPSLVTPAAR